MARAITYWFGFVLALVTMTVAQGRTIYVSPSGNDATAQPDDPASPFGTLTNACRALQNGDRLEIREGSYPITPGYPTSYFPMPDYAPMQLENLTNIVVTGVGTAEIYGEGPGDFLMIQNCSSIRIENLTFKGNRPGIPEGRPDPLFSTVLLRGINDGLYFENCRFLSFGDHAISHLWGPKRSYNMVVTNCYFADGGDGDVTLHEDGAAISGISSGARIVNNTIDRCFRGIEVEGAFHEKVTDVLIEGNIITNCYTFGIMLFATYSAGNARPEAYSDIRIINNRISNLFTPAGADPRTQVGILLLGGKNLNISGNHIEKAGGGMGISVTSGQLGIQDVLISSNVVRTIRARGIQVYQQSYRIENVRILDNQVSGIGDEGILINANRVECQGNWVENTAWSGERGAITLHNHPSIGATNSLVADNTIRNANTNYAAYGIWLSGVTNSLVYGNSFEAVRIKAIRDDAVGSKLLAKISAVAKTNNIVNFSVTGNPGTAYQLKSSQDLSEWKVVQEVTCPPSGTFSCTYTGPFRLPPPQTFFTIASVPAP
jgi:hypothetical protein